MKIASPEFITVRRVFLVGIKREEEVGGEERSRREVPPYATMEVSLVTLACSEVSGRPGRYSGTGTGTVRWEVAHRVTSAQSTCRSRDPWSSFSCRRPSSSLSSPPSTSPSGRSRSVSLDVLTYYSNGLFTVWTRSWKVHYILDLSYKNYWHRLNFLR